MTDTEMIDWLEEFVNREHGLILHDTKRPFPPCSYHGLGIWGIRTLRKAIATAAGRSAQEKSNDR